MVPAAAKLTAQAPLTHANDWHSLLAPHSLSVIQGIPPELVLDELPEPPEPPLP